jgi:hypothetical protein
MSIASEVFGEWKPELVEVTPPGCDKPVKLRYPTYGEWHKLAVAHQQLAGKAPDATLIIDTIAACIADDAGKRKLSSDKARGLLDASPRAVMWLYKQCWETVLKSDDETVAELEKNSAAGQE